MTKETNPIAELNAEMWVVVTPYGTMLTNTLSIVSERASFWNFILLLEDNPEFRYLEDKIAELEALGYRCIPVSVNIKPIEQ